MMKMLALALLLAAAPVLAGDLRLFNPTGGERIAPPTPPGPSLTLGVTAFRTETLNGVEWQQLQAVSAEACAATAPLMLPLNGCRFGSAVAAVAPVDGAAY